MYSKHWNEEYRPKEQRQIQTLNRMGASWGSSQKGGC